MAKSSHEFTASDWEKLQAAKRLLYDTIAIIDKAEACGVECQGYRDVHSEILRRFELIEQHFMPQRPR